MNHLVTCAGMTILVGLTACGGHASSGESASIDLVDGGSQDAGASDLGDTGSSSGDAVSETLPDAGEGAADAAEGRCSTPLVGPSVAMALTKSEYNHTVRDLLGDATSPADSFTDDPWTAGFRVSPPQSLPPLRIQQYQAAAKTIADAAIGRLGSILTCDPAKLGEDGCARDFITTFGLRAYRHPLTSAEMDALFKPYASVRASGDFAHAIGAIIAAALASPSFYTIQEQGAPSGPVLLRPHAMASRLSYFIYRSMPDTPLFEAAAASELFTPDQIASQVRRMLASPKAHDGILDFFREWLSLDQLSTLTKEPAVTPNFDTLRGYMSTETTMFAEGVFFGDGQWISLLTSPDTWINEPLAELYGVGGISGTSFQRVILDSAVRSGILTQPSILALTALPDESSPTRRGLFVTRKLLCGDLPPDLPNTMLPPLSPGQSNRQRYESLASSPSCAGCHHVIDPLGFGFEEFDAIGRHRTMDNGQQVDSSGTLVGIDVEGSFLGAAELSRRLARSLQIEECAARQWFRFALGRLETDADHCSIEAAFKGLQSSGDLKDLVVAIATSDAFRYAAWGP